MNNKIIKRMCVLLCFVFIFTVIGEPGSYVNADSKNSNMRSLCRYIKYCNRMNKDGYYYDYRSAYDYSRGHAYMIYIWRMSSNKIRVLYTSKLNINGTMPVEYSMFEYSPKMKKMKIYIETPDFEVIESITVSKFSGKKSQIKFTQIKTYDCSRKYAKNFCAKYTKETFDQFQSKINSNLLNLRDIGFKKYNQNIYYMN